MTTAPGSRSGFSVPRRLAFGAAGPHRRGAMSSQLAVWISAARPQTLPAAVVPVAIGSALAARDHTFALFPALLCLAFALLVQVGTNFANDYFDARSGADAADRIGPTRATASGLVRPETMWRATLLTLGLAFLVGLGLVPFGGWWLVAVGLASLACAVAYTGGPYPLGYHGWGDVFVILFFGLIAVSMTYYVQAGSISAASLWLGLGCGLMVNLLLIVNNYRDVEGDARVGKRTLIVRLGRPFGRAFFAGSYLVAGGSVLAALASSLGLLQGLVVIAGWIIGGWAHIGLLQRLEQARTPADFGAVLKTTSMEIVGYGAVVSLLTVAVGISGRSF